MPRSTNRLRVFRILRGHDVYAAESRLQRAPQASIAAITPRAQAGIDDRHLRSGSLGGPDQIGPELELHERQHRGPNPRDGTPGRPAKVEGCVERDQVRIGAASDREPRRGGRRDHHLPVRPAAGHFLHQGAKQQHFTHTDGMEPQARVIADPQRCLSQQFLDPAFAVLPVSKPSVKEQRRENHQGRGVDQVEREWHLEGILSRNQSSTVSR